MIKSKFTYHHDLGEMNKFLVDYVTKKSVMPRKATPTTIPVVPSINLLPEARPLVERAREFAMTEDPAVKHMLCGSNSTWAPKGTGSPIHDHATEQWVVVYYPIDAQGMLVIKDDTEYMPQEGLMVLFPGHATHWIEPNPGNTPRISISTLFYRDRASGR